VPVMSAKDDIARKNSVQTWRKDERTRVEVIDR